MLSSIYTRWDCYSDQKSKCRC